LGTIDGSHQKVKPAGFADLTRSLALGVAAHGPPQRAGICLESAASSTIAQVGNTSGKWGVNWGWDHIHMRYLCECWQKNNQRRLIPFK
jgi:hypothetical protein